ncbi:MAG: serine/threonine-protein kinase [Pseudomonadales bacterium]
MDAERWQLIERLFREALTLADADAQRRFLSDACDGDEELTAQILGMLEADRGADSLLDRSVGEVASAMLGNGAPPPGTSIGRYSIRRVLGEGGMGIVCLGERSDLGSVVAIKLLRDAWLSPARRERFRSEQRVLAQLNHPGIARLYDADTLPDGTPWFAMEYIEGLPLTAWCVKHDLSVEGRLQLFRQACEAVRYAHAHAVIHRDIKPSNVLVNADGNAKLLDFGIARQLDALDGASDQTRTMTRLMTPAYAAPEQLRGEELGVQADVYSLGVVLYELLTGQLPFDLKELSPLEAISAVTGTTPVKPSVRGAHSGKPDVPGRAAWTDLDVLCLTALHADRARRYSSVEALIRDVDHYLHSKPLDAQPDHLGYRTGKFLRRHWPVVAVTAAALIVALGLTTVFTLRLTAARDTARAEAARTERVQRFMTNLFQGGEALAGPRDDMRVVEMLERGARDAETLASDPPMQAELLFNLAGIYQQLGRLDEADRLYARSLELREKAFGPHSSEVAATLVATGSLRIDQARLDDAEPLIRKGLAVAEQLRPADHPQIVTANLSLGRVLRERGEYEAAIAVLTQTVERQSASGTADLDRALTLTALADAHYAAGHYRESETLYRDILALHRANVGNVHPLVAGDLTSLAAIEQDLGFYERAEALAREALAINEAYYGADSPLTADNLTSLGRALLYEAKYDEAVGALERALRVQEAAFGPMHPLVAEAVNELGNVLAMQDRYTEAAEYFERAAGIYRSVHGERHYLVAITLSNVAYMHTQQGDYAEAERRFRHVVELFTETLGADNVNTGIAQIKLGRTLRLAGAYAEAGQQSLAGYEILAAQANPSISFLRAARDDLILAYDALGRSEEAARFRAELAALEQTRVAGE